MVGDCRFNRAWDRRGARVIRKGHCDQLRQDDHRDEENDGRNEQEVPLVEVGFHVRGGPDKKVSLHGGGRTPHPRGVASTLINRRCPAGSA